MEPEDFPKWMKKAFESVRSNTESISALKDEVLPGDFIKDQEYREEFAAQLRKALIRIESNTHQLHHLWFIGAIVGRKLRNIEALLAIAVCLLAINVCWR